MLKKKPIEIINFNCSNDESGAFERQALYTIFFDTYKYLASSGCPENRQSELVQKIKTLREKINQEGNYNNPAYEEYSKWCQELIDFCESFISQQGNPYSKEIIMLLCLKVRVQKLKGKCDRQESDMFEPYYASYSSRYLNPKLFHEAEAEVLKEVYPAALKLLWDKLNQPAYVHLDIPAVAWIVKQFNIDIPLSIQIFRKLLDRLVVREGRDRFELGNCLIENIPMPVIEEIKQKLLDKDWLPAGMPQLHEMLNILFLKDLGLGEYFLNNIKLLNDIAACHHDKPFFYAFLRKLTPQHGYSRRALQLGFDYNHVIEVIVKSFPRDRKDATDILYEALARGDASTAQRLKDLINTHEVRGQETKEMSSVQVNSGEGSKSKFFVQTHQQYRKYEDGLAFNLQEFFNYLEEKYNQLEKTQSEQHFIKHPNNFVAMLTKLGLIPEDSVTEFKMEFTKLFNVTFLPEQSAVNAENSKSQIDPETRTLIEKRDIQIRELTELNQNMAKRFEGMFETLQEQILRLQARVDELEKERHPKETASAHSPRH